MDRFLVSVDWLLENIAHSDVKVIDGSWNMPGSESAFDAYSHSHIPGARFFDIDTITDKGTCLPHMAPDLKTFEEKVGQLGINETDRVVIYDQKGLFSAARVWWTFRLFGHSQVAILNGGFPAWLSANCKLSSESTNSPDSKYNGRFNGQLVASAKQVLATISDDRFTIVDARPAGRFEGHASEPRPNLRSGAIPSSLNIPHTQLLSNGCLKTREELAEIWNDAGLAKNSEIITSCGSGITASVLFFALSYSGWTKVKVYDGSWAEWGNQDNNLSQFPVTGYEV